MSPPIDPPSDCRCGQPAVVATRNADGWHWYCTRHLHHAEDDINRIHMVETLWGDDVE